MDNTKAIIVKGYTIDLNNIVGKGQYGIVYNCTHPNIKKELVAKMISTKQLDNKMVQREVAILSAIKEIRNPYLVDVYEILDHNPPQPDTPSVIIIMDKCNGGDLTTQIRSHQTANSWFTIEEIIKILHHIVLGYRVLFESNTIHRDIKPANILIHDGIYKLSDFGMGRMVDDVQKRQLLTKVGTPAYAAPQLFLEPTFSSKADVYSLGVIAYQLCTKNLPFQVQTQAQLIQALKQTKHQPIKLPQIQIQGDQNLKAALALLIEIMLQYDEEKRISWPELFNHEIFKITVPTKPNKIRIIDSINVPQKTELEDSIFLLNQNCPQLKFDVEQFKLMTGSTNQNPTKAERLIHLMKIMLAKVGIAEQTYIMFTNELQELILSSNTILPHFNLFHYELLLTCVVGYKYKLLSNIFGFLYNSMDYICFEMKQPFSDTNIQIAITELENDQSQEVQWLKQTTMKMLIESQNTFNYQENKLIKMLKVNNYPTDISNFSKLLALQNNTEFRVYAQWFKYFYNKDYRPALPCDPNQNYNFQYLKLISLFEQIAVIDTDFPFLQYLQQNPKDINLSLDTPQQCINYIVNKRAGNQKH